MLKKQIQDAIKISFSKAEMPGFSIDDADSKFGDYSTNAAMILAKQIGDNPLEVAKKLIDNIGQDGLIETMEVAGPGFINFRIQVSFLNSKILEIIKAGDNFGKSDLGKDLKVNVEFISANPTGPLTLGNGRGGFFGDTLARVFEAYGSKVTREYYINDRGAQIIALGHSVLKDDEAVYKGSYIDEIAPRITAKTPTEAGFQAAAILTEEYIKKTVKKMGIDFDHFFSEKSLFDNGTVFAMLERLGELRLTYEKDGALWLKTSDYGDDKDRVLVTKEGEHTYFAADIAYHFDKIRRGYDLLINFWGADHHGYVGRMQAAVEILRKEEDWNGELQIVIAQLVRLMSDGKEVKMSKRAGTYVTLDELLEEVGPDVTRFFFLDRSLDTHMDFDLDLAKEKSQKNPCFYIQYAYARISSILNKIDGDLAQDLAELKEKEELELIKELIKLPELVNEIVADMQIQKLTFYAIKLAESFHHFYENCPVIKAEDPKVSAARVQLLLATKIVLKNTLDLIGISAPEKM